jgi:hypothetical protein
MVNSRNFPAAQSWIDQDPSLTTEITEIFNDGTRFILVTQRGEDAGQVLIELDASGNSVNAISDTVIDVGRILRATTARARTRVSACSAAQHALVFQQAQGWVTSHKSSAAGPDGGNLACAWMVRRLICSALSMMIYDGDGTLGFGEFLVSNYPSSFAEDEVPAGGIIISPTEVTGSHRNVGHIGILGSPTGDDTRLIYSNSSSAAEWQQNRTLRSWRDRYEVAKGLEVLFFPIPDRNLGTCGSDFPDD